MSQGECNPIDLHQLREELGRQLALAGYDRIWEHSQQVADEAVSLAQRFGVDVGRAEAAALLHDTGALIPAAERTAFLKERGVETFPEERDFPMILHQRVSAVLARERFGVEDEGILGAAGCHTTLKAGASKPDMIVFLADKIRWDREGTPPYLPVVLEGLEHSLEAGALAFVTWLLERRESLKTVHPWLLEAEIDLRNRIGPNSDISSGEEKK